MKAGDHVKLAVDDWNLLGLVGVVTDPAPADASRHCEIKVRGETVFASVDDLEPTDEQLTPAPWPAAKP